VTDAQSREWDDEDDITHDSPRIVIASSSLMLETVLTKVIAGDVRLYTCNNSRMAGWIFTKFVMVVMPLEPGQLVNFLQSVIPT
jgi:hypothetical protein